MKNALDEFKDVNDARIFAENIIATVREPLLVLNGELRVVFANAAFCAKFQTAVEESVGKRIYELGNGQWDMPRLREALVNIIPQSSHFDDYEVEHDFPGIGRRIMLLNGRQVKQAGGRKNFILLAIEDVTDRIMAERKLRESEDKFRSFVQTINSIILRFDKEGRISFFNRFAEQIFGYREEELLGNAVIGTIIPEKDEEGHDLRGMIKDVLDHPERYYYKQSEGRKKDGGRVWFHWSAKDIRDERGDIKEILVDGNDITGEMVNRRMRREMEELVATSPDIMARFDGTMRMVYANPLFLRLLGRRIEEVIGKTVREIGLPGEKAAALEEALRKAKAGQERYKTVIRLDDHAYHVQVVYEDANVQSFKVYAADITDRKELEDTLRRNEYELRSVIENTPDIYFRLNRQLRYIFVNPTYEKLTGLTKEQFIGKTNSQLGMPREMVEFWQSAAQRALASGNEHSVEFEIAGFLGKRYYAARIIPEFEKSGLAETVLVVARDITERKQMEQEVISLKR